MSDDKSKGRSGNTDDGATPSDKGSEQPKGKLESLLEEWDSKGAKGTDSGKPDDKGKPAGTGDGEGSETPKDASAWAAIDDQDHERLLERLRADLDVQDFEVNGWLEGRAIKDPRIIDYFNNRHSSELSKGQYREIVNTLAAEFQEYAKGRYVQKSKESDEESETREEKGSERGDDKGLTAAVRSSRDAKPSGSEDDVNWAGLSGHEFAQERGKVFKAMKEGKFAK